MCHSRLNSQNSLGLFKCILLPHLIQKQMPLDNQFGKQRAPLGSKLLPDKNHPQPV
jgi:hypothetical protein